MINHYDVLKVARDATVGEISRAYRNMALLVHPDRTVRLDDTERLEAEAKFKQINEAHETLSDPELRAKYDRQLLAEETKPRTKPRTRATDPARSYDESMHRADLGMFKLQVNALFSNILPLEREIASLYQQDQHLNIILIQMYSKLHVLTTRFNDTRLTQDSANSFITDCQQIIQEAEQAYAASESASHPAGARMFGNTLEFLAKKVSRLAQGETEPVFKDGFQESIRRSDTEKRIASLKEQINRLRPPGPEEPEVPSP